MIEIVRILDRPRVELGALALSALVDVIGWTADTTAAAAERYAETARWIATATRCVP